MANIRFETEIESLNGIKYKVQIYDTLYTGSASDFSLGSAPVIKFDSAGSEKFNEILASKCELEFVLETSSQVTFWESSFRSDTYAERDVYVFIYQFTDSYKLMWTGYVLQDLSTTEDVTLPKSILLQAVDGLSVLKEIPFVPNALSAGTSPFTESQTYIPAGTTPTNADSSWGSGGYHRMSFWIAEVLGYAGTASSSLTNASISNYEISISANWYNTKMDATEIQTNDTFFLTAINARQFYKANEASGSNNDVNYNAMSCYDALRNMLRCFGARIFYWGHKFYIIQIGLYSSLETGTNASPVNIKTQLYNKAGVKQSSGNLVGNNDITRYSLSTTSSRPTTPGGLKKLSGTTYDDFAVYKKAMTSFTSVSNLNLFNSFVLIPGATNNPPSMVGGFSGGSQIAAVDTAFENIGTFTDAKDFTGFFINIFVKFKNGSGSGNVYVRNNWTIQAKPSSTASWDTSATLVPVILVNNSTNAITVEWHEAINFSTFNPNTQNLQFRNTYGKASAVPSGHTAKNPFSSKIPVNLGTTVRSVVQDTGIADSFNNVLPTASVMSGDWDFRFFAAVHAKAQSSIGLQYRHRGHGVQNFNPTSSFGRPPFAASAVPTLLAPNGDGGDISYQVMASNNSYQSVFAVVSGGQIGAYASHTNVSTNTNASYVKQVPDTLWGDTLNTNAPGSLYVDNGSAFEFTSFAGQWGKGVLNGTDSLTELLLKEVLFHNTKKTYKGNFTFALSNINRDLSSNAKFPKQLSPLTIVKDIDFSNRKFVMLNGGWNLITNEVSGSWFEYIYESQNTTVRSIDTGIGTTINTGGGGSIGVGNNDPIDIGTSTGFAPPSSSNLVSSGFINTTSSSVSARLSGNVTEVNDQSASLRSRFGREPFTTTTGVIESGSAITTIPIDGTTVLADTFKQGDVLIVVDNEVEHKVVIATDVGAGATSLTVTNTTLDENIPPGAFIYPDSDDLYVQYQHKTRGSVGSFNVTSTGMQSGSVNITSYIDDDSFGTASANSLATSESIKNYVDAQVDTADTLQEVTNLGNTTTNSVNIGSATTPTKKLTVTTSTTGDGILGITTNGEEWLQLQNDNSTTFPVATLRMYYGATPTVKITALSSEMKLGDIQNKMTFFTSSAERMRLTSGGQLLIATTTSATNEYLSIGTTSIYNTTAHIYSNAFGASTLRLTRGSNVWDINNNGIFNISFGGVDRFSINTNGQATFASQVTIPATPVAATDAASKGYVDAQVDTADTLSEVLALGNTTSGTDIIVSHNDQLKLGDDGEFQIWHQSGATGNSFIDETNTGDLYIRSNSAIRLSHYANNTASAVFNPSGNVELYYNTAKKFETTSGGVLVTGELEATTLDINGNADISGSTTMGGNLQITKNAATLNLVGTDHSYIQWFPDGVSAGRKAYTGYGGATSNHFSIVNEISGGQVQINTNGGTIQLFDNTVVSGELEATSLDINGNADISGTLTTGDITGQSITLGDGSTAEKLRVYYSDNTYVNLQGYGLEMSRHTSYIRPTVTNTNGLRIGNHSLNWSYISNYAIKHYWYNASSELMRLTSGGNLLIGTTNNYDEGKLQVFGDINIINSNGSNPTDAGSLYFGETGGVWGTSFYGFRINLDGSANNLQIQGNSTTFVKTIISMQRDTGVVTLGHGLIGTTATFSGQVTIPATPVASTDAASKGYVDAQVGTADTLQEVTDLGNTTTNSIMIGSSSSPSTKLHVVSSDETVATIERNSGSGYTVLNIKNGVNTTGNSVIRFSDSTASKGAIDYEHADDSMRFNTNAYERMRITSGGNLLISTTTDSGAKLDVSGVDNGVFFRRNTGQYFKFTTDAHSNRIESAGKTVFLGTTDAQTLYLKTNDTSRLTITSGGNVLINTTTDSGNAKLQVAGNIEIGNGFKYYTGFGTSNFLTYNVWNINSSAFSYINQASSGDFGIKTAGTERLRITNGGNLLLGTTVDSGSKLVVADLNNFNSSDVLALQNKADQVDEYVGLSFQTAISSDGIQAAIRSLNGPSSNDVRLGFFTSSTSGASITEGMSISHSGNVGINQVNPTEKLHVVGNVRISEVLYISSLNQLLRVNNNEFEINNYSSDKPILFKTSDGGSIGERMRLTSGGNVGIGTSSPSVQLEVHGSDGIKVTQNSTALSAGYFAQLKSDYGTNSLRLISKTGDVFRATNFGQDVSFLTGNPTSEKMIILANGNVGIGTSSPTRPLSVHKSSAGSIANFLHYTDASNFQGLYIQVSQTTDNVILQSSGNNSGGFEFYSGNTEKMRLTSGGNLLLNTTTDAGYKLDVSGSFRASQESTFVSNLLFPDNARIKLGTSSDLQIYHDGLNSYINDIGIGNLILTTSQTYFQTGGANRMIINSSGNVLINTTTDSGAKLYVNGVIRAVGGGIQAAQDYGFTLNDEAGNNRYGLKFGAAGTVGGSDLLMLTNRSIYSAATSGGIVTIGGNSSTTGVSEVEIARFDPRVTATSGTQKKVTLDAVLELTAQTDPADPANSKSIIWMDTNGNIKAKMTDSGGTTVTRTIAAFEG